MDPDGAAREDEDPDPIGFGFHVGAGGPGEVSWSSVFNIVRDTHGVRKIAASGLLLNGGADDVVLTIREFPVLGTVRVVDAESGSVVYLK